MITLIDNNNRQVFSMSGVNVAHNTYLNISNILLSENADYKCITIYNTLS